MVSSNVCQSKSVVVDDAARTCSISADAVADATGRFSSAGD